METFVISPVRKYTLLIIDVAIEETFNNFQGKPRMVEVKLKCKKSDSPSVVTLYLLEPKTCE